VGEASVLVCVASGHRGEAFEACRFCIDKLKQDAPIWKKEVINLYAPQQFDITNNPRGLYLLKAETSKGINFQKIILQ